jgi:lipopolysaccharide heptosyltransferase II
MKPIDLSRVKNILIIMMGGIGNMIFLTPALKALRKALPSSTLSFLLGPYEAEKVVEGSHYIDQKITVEPDESTGISANIKLIRKLKKRDFNLSITSTGTNPLKSGLLCALAGIEYRLGENIRGMGLFYNLKVPFDRNRHEVESNIQLIQRLGIEVDDRNLFIQRSEEDKNSAQKFFTRHNLEGKLVVGMHPGSGIHQAGFKRWPKERFSQLADKLINDFGASVILFGGTEETELANEMKDMMESPPLIMTGKTTLPETAALIEKCRLFFSNDSGLLHVACAVSTPAIGMFGPTSPKRTGPYSGSSSVIRKDLDCSPCYFGKPVHCDHFDCLNLVTVDDVIQEAKKRLEKHGS